MNKNMIFAGICSILIVFSGCVDQSSNQEEESNDTYENNSWTQSLSEIALTESDFNTNMDMVFNNHTTKPYTMENLTGNGKEWVIQEGYFSSFACNTSRVSQSILRLNTAENATVNIQLNKQFLLDDLLDEGYTNFSMDTIGEDSFLLKSTKPFQESTIDVWTIQFTFQEIVVSLIGYASDKDDMIHAAETIENNILSHLS